jgi:predicted lipid-binding transport protein (Tim44 family)
MNRKTGLLATLFFALALMLASVHEAQAKRMGGGKSFGGKPSYSAPYQRSTSPSPSSQPTRSASQQQAASQNQTARQSWASRGGLMGMLGGLALGGLLGSLFFGGAFENFNFMDILLFAGIAYLLYRLFVAKTARQGQALGNAYGRNSYQEADSAPVERSGEQATAGPSGFNTDVLFNKGQNAAPRNAEFATGNIPAGFDQPAFLVGAESAYRYLQTAWDSRDLAAIRGLSTDKVFAEIQDQLRASGVANKTEVLKLSSELLEVREVGSELEAVVLFDVMMREDDGQAEPVREVWHFTKSVNSKQPKWFLDGIQQLEA